MNSAIMADQLYISAHCLVSGKERKLLLGEIIA